MGGKKLHFLTYFIFFKFENRSKQNMTHIEKMYAVLCEKFLDKCCIELTSNC